LEIFGIVATWPSSSCIPKIKNKSRSIISPIASDAAQSSITVIRDSESKLLTKKNEMSKFQEEYVEAKKRYEIAVKKLAEDTDTIIELRRTRDEAYDQMLDISSMPYAEKIIPVQSKGFLSSLFG